MEFWTLVRFMLYPVLLVFGGAWCIFFRNAYRCSRRASNGWAFWLGAAVTLTGACGFVALLVARAIGFGSVTSALFTLGPVAMSVVVVAGSVNIWMAAWRSDAATDGEGRYGGWTAETQD